MDQLNAVLDEEIVDAFLLIGGETDAGGEIGIFPPGTGGQDGTFGPAHTVARTSPCAVWTAGHSSPGASGWAVLWATSWSSLGGWRGCILRDGGEG